MNDNVFEIDSVIRNQVDILENKTFIEVDNKTLAVLNAYKKTMENQNGIINQLELYKEIQLGPFTIGDAISDGICLVDNKGIIRSISKGYTEITEITEEEIIGKHVDTLIKDGYFSEAVSLSVIKKKNKVSSLSVIIRNNKKVLITGTPFFNEAGEVTYVLTVMRDLTELIKLKDELEEAENKSKRYLDELRSLKNKYRKTEGIIGENIKIKELKELIKYVAKTEATVLITGETGSGKEVFARQIHLEGSRKNMPYVKVNCAAIPDTLMESELFGYEKGAFTGAQNKDKLGMFEMANGGTILLDEIGEMPLNLQSKLLRVIQEKELIRVGGTKTIKLDVRIIASTNEKLNELIKAGKFREDLFYRLNVVPIKIPPLRERKDDIPILANNFLERLNIKYNKDKHFEDIALTTFQYHDWPGNVRELENAIERLVVINDNKYINSTEIANMVGMDKISMPGLESDLPLKKAVDMLERELIENALRKHGSTYKAAKVLGVTQPTVFRKAKALGIPLSNA